MDTLPTGMGAAPRTFGIVGGETLDRELVKVDTFKAGSAMHAQEKG
ncbi:MAG TPA: hypothetical protein VL614_10700 [Acetobacteraceae bacterium]|jgi:hypothetical protein|nr:hypothetical protein [Acetobacteraceae bacterium]